MQQPAVRRGGDRQGRVVLPDLRGGDGLDRTRLSRAPAARDVRGARAGRRAAGADLPGRHALHHPRAAERAAASADDEGRSAVVGSLRWCRRGRCSGATRPQLAVASCSGGGHASLCALELDRARALQSQLVEVADEIELFDVNTPDDLLQAAGDVDQCRSARRALPEREVVGLIAARDLHGDVNVLHPRGASPGCRDAARLTVK